MKRTTTSLLLLLVSLCSGSLAQESTVTPPPNGFGGNIFVGTRGLDNSNYLGRVSEYDTARDGLRPSIGTSFWFQKDNYFLDVAGEYRGDAKDQKYGIDFQANRYLRIRSYYMQFLHRLDNDPLDDLDAAKGGPMVWSENNVPGIEYMPGYSELKTDIEFVMPNAEWLRLRAGYRTFERSGAYHTSTMSKCSSCHVQSFTKNIDQRQHDLSAGLSLQFEKVSIDYEYLNRQFNERGLTPMMEWDAAVHPVSLAPVFGNRVSYDQANGQLPFDMVPDNRKSRHHLRARVELPKDGRLSGALTKSSSNNKFTGLGVQSWGWNGKFTIPLGKKLQFLTQAKQLDFDSEDVYVTIGEPAAIGGPDAGQTYSEAYPEFGEASFMRHSTRSRNRFSWRGELSANVARLTTLRGGYEFRRVKRDHYETAQTDTNRLYFTFNSRKRKTSSGDWSFRFRYQLDDNDDPFMHHKAALPPALQPYPTPGASPFVGEQYFNIYAARQADMSSIPTVAHLLEPTVTWMPSQKFSANLHYRYKNLKNDDLNFSDWSRTVHMPGVELWWAPLEKLDFTASYTFHNERSDTLFGIPVYDG